jgi:hypothetical protein
MFSLNQTILLVSMRTRYPMSDACGQKILMQLSIFPSPVRLDGFKLSV